MRRFTGALLTSIVAAALFAGTGSAETVATPTLTRALILDIARVPAPEPGVGLQIHADFPAESPLVLGGVNVYSLTADITPTGEVVTRTLLTREDFATAAGADDAGVEECDDPAFVPTGVTWAEGSMPILWRFDKRSTPDEIKRYKTLLTVRSGHRVWPQAQSKCAERAHYSFAYNYLGHTRMNPKYDEVNLVDFGALGKRALAVNYTWYTGANKIVEVDLRLNKADYKWTNVPGVNRYQVRNVVAHELGHQIGLDDLGAPHQGLTMFGQIGKGETSKETLGRGDLRGADAIAP